MEGGLIRYSALRGIPANFHMSACAGCGRWKYKKKMTAVCFKTSSTSPRVAFYLCGQCLADLRDRYEVPE